MPDGSLEYLVRPYVTPNAQGAIIIPSAPRGSREKATLTWGQPTTIPPIQTGENFQVVCCKDGLTEEKRKNEPLRVYQGGDKNSPNYIDWERPLQMDLKKKESNTCGDNQDDISNVAQEVHADLAMWESIMHSGTLSGSSNCAAQWNFKSKL
jgi:hypothetical protein